MEKKTIVRSDNHITIDGWMLNELGLSGAELIIYAVIYGFSQADDTWCTASQAYIAAWAGVSTRAMISAVNRLEEKGYIIRVKSTCKKGFQCVYKAVRPSENEAENEEEADVKKLHIRCEETSYPDVKKLHIRCEETSHNNIEDNIDNNIADNKENKKRKSEEELRQDFEELWKLYPRKEGKKDAFKAYVKAIKSGTATNEQIRQGIENYKAWLKAKNETTYIKQGSTYFNKEHWTDEFDLSQINRGDPFDVRNQYWDENDPTVH